MTGRRVHAAGTGFEGDVIAEHQQGIARVKRMPAVFPFKQLGREGRQNRKFIDAEGFKDFFVKALGHDQHFAAAIHRNIGECGVETDAEVGRDGPGSGGPDHEKELFTGQGGKFRRQIVGISRITSYNVCYTKLLRVRLFTNCSQNGL